MALSARRFSPPVLTAVLLTPLLAAALTLAFPAGPASAAAAGSAWSASTAPSAGLSPAAASAPFGEGLIAARIACPAVGSCVVVGNYWDVSSHVQGLIETLAGGAWRAITAPTAGLNPAAAADPGARLLDVSCPAVGSCVAVGEYSSASGQDGLIETLSGGSWTASTAPDAAASQTVRLLSIACPTTTSCVAVGDYEDTSGNWHGLIETLASGAWLASTMPASGLSPGPGTGPSAGQALDFVSCPGVGSCAAAGLYTDSARDRRGLLAVLADGTWTAQAAPTGGLNAATDPFMIFGSLSCPATGSCIAVGQYLDASRHEDGLIETLAGVTWASSVAPTAGLRPAPGSGPTDVVQLDHVSCPALGACVAAGQYNDTSGSRDGLFEMLAGGSWTASTAPTAGLTPTAQFVNSMTDISCAAARSCTAIGTYQDTSGNEHGLIETLAGEKWTAKTASIGGLNPPVTFSSNQLQPPYTAAITPNSVACPASGSCVAVGYYADPALSMHGLIETLSSAAVPAPGYWLGTSAGHVYAFHAPGYGPAAGLTGKVVGIVADGPGYLLATSAGDVFSVNAGSYGSMVGKKLPAPVVGIAADPATSGYWLVTSAGNIYSFNAPWYGSAARMKLRHPVVGIAADGAGYVLATRAGQVLTFHTRSHGSMSGRRLPAPIVGITADPATGGYWLTTSAGNVYGLDAPWLGSEAGKKLRAPVIGIAADGSGYVLATSAGDVYAFNTTWYGSEGGKKLATPVAGIAAAP
jgi:hypothetical protein